MKAAFLCNSCKLYFGFAIKIYLLIIVQTQDIGVIWFAGYKIVLSLVFFKPKILQYLWITG
ncbi:hypothetical protein EGH82_15950 [Vibrio ponticus]|uniref:Uncharacterized protein n=1 Tax=Vibrio ponticus TaxID=265668 RepID=A0A3N3DWR5_9VIBR|nr:hypothetical protein EGH82_15950 [Vibrio ponticus]